MFFDGVSHRSSGRVGLYAFTLAQCNAQNSHRGNCFNPSRCTFVAIHYYLPVSNYFF